MKSFITLTACLFFGIASFAYSPTRLTITNFVNTNLRIVIDGNKYDHIGNSLSLDNLTTGYHNIKVYQVNNGLWKSNRLVYSSSVYLKPNYQVNLVINRQGNVTIAEQQMGRRNGNNNGYGYGRNNNDDRNDNYPDYGNRGNDGFGKQGNQDNKRGYPSRGY